VSEQFDEYGNYIGAGYGRYEPQQANALDLDPASLSQFAQDAAAAGAARALQEVQQANQTNQAAAQYQRWSETLLEAEQLIEQGRPGWWNARERLDNDTDSGFGVTAVPSELAFQTIAQHPTMLPADAVGDPRRVADALDAAYTHGAIEAMNQATNTKATDDSAAIDNIFRAHRQSWSQRRANVHDILDGQ
jgi:hypothetical protein